MFYCEFDVVFTEWSLSKFDTVQTSQQRESHLDFDKLRSMTGIHTTGLRDPELLGVHGHLGLLISRQNLVPASMEECDEPKLYRCRVELFRSNNGLRPIGLSQQRKQRK